MIGEKEKIIEIPAILSSLSFTKDRGLRLGFLSQELTKEEKDIVQDYFQKFGYLLFKANEFQEKDVPKIQAVKKCKSKSQILRQHIWRLWKNSNSTLTDEEFYIITIDKLINLIDRRINDL